MIHDDLARHFALAGSFERAAVPLGMYVAWCANLQLLGGELTASPLLLRVRYREITGAELVVAGCGGELRDAHLNAEGRAFTGDYFEDFYPEFAACFAVAPDDIYRVPDDWEHYDRLAPRLTARLMAFRADGGVASAEAGQRGGWWNRLWSR